jgi:hypothetical protein
MFFIVRLRFGKKGGVMNSPYDGMDSDGNWSPNHLPELTETLRETEKKIAQDFKINPEWARKEYGCTSEQWEEIRQWPGEC